MSTSLLDERELTAEERAAIADEARPGVWIEEDLILAKINNPNIISQRTGRPIPPIRPSSGVRGDGRALDQEQTDQLVVLEVMRTMPEWRPMIRELVAPGQLPPTWIVNVDGALAEQQRGGLHSDPTIRLFAYRAWGDRDRRWFRHDVQLCRIYGFESIAATVSDDAFTVDVCVDGRAFAYQISASALEDSMIAPRMIYEMLERACRDAGLLLSGQRPAGDPVRAELLMKLLAAARYVDATIKSSTPGRATHSTR